MFRAGHIAYHPACEGFCHTLTRIRCRSRCESNNPPGKYPNELHRFGSVILNAEFGIYIHVICTKVHALYRNITTGGNLPLDHALKRYIQHHTGFEVLGNANWAHDQAGESVGAPLARIRCGPWYKRYDT